MSRRSLMVLAILVILLVIAGAVGWQRWHQRPVPAAASATTAPPPTSAASSEQSRGEVSIEPRRQQLIGVETAAVRREPVALTVRTTGVVRADETRLTDVNARVDGWIRELYVDYVGQPVRRGDRLLTIYSPELIATQNELAVALKNRDQLAGADVSEARVYAEQLVDAARERLRVWGMAEDDIRSVERTRQALTTVTLTAPASGIVTDKPAVRGLHVSAGQTLYRIGDLSSVWLEADVYERELAAIRVGSRASVTLPAYPGRVFAGRAIYIVPTVDTESRTGKVRFAFDNAGGALKPGMFATVELRSTEHLGLTVPVNAVLDSGAEQVVFVASGDGMFTPRRVTVGQRLPDVTEILTGLKEGDQVATAATFFLDSESQLRAGLENYQPRSGDTATAPATQQVGIAFHATPDPPKTGDSTFEVRVTDPGGQPVADAEVSVQLFMPAMPTMNMPAMRNETKLLPAGGGVYRGPGQVMMAGHWDVTVTVTKAGQPLGRKQFALAAK